MKADKLASQKSSKKEREVLKPNLIEVETKDDLVDNQRFFYFEKRGDLQTAHAVKQIEMMKNIANMEQLKQ